MSGALGGSLLLTDSPDPVASPWLFWVAALAGCFEEHDTGGDADVERRNLARRRDADQEVALFLEQFVQATGFAARNEGAVAAIVRRVVRFCSAFIEAVNPERSLF